MTAPVCSKGSHSYFNVIKTSPTINIYCDLIKFALSNIRESGRVWIEQEKGISSERKRDFLGNVVLCEILPVAEGEGCVPKGIMELVKSKEKREQDVEVNIPKVHSFMISRPLLAIAIPEEQERSFNYIIHPQWQPSQLPSQLIHDCLYGYIWLGRLLCLHIPACRTHVNS